MSDTEETKVALEADEELAQVNQVDDVKVPAKTIEKLEDAELVDNNTEELIDEVQTVENQEKEAIHKESKEEAHTKINEDAVEESKKNTNEISEAGFDTEAEEQKQADDANNCEPTSITEPTSNGDDFLDNLLLQADNKQKENTENDEESDVDSSSGDDGSSSSDSDSDESDESDSNSDSEAEDEELEKDTKQIEEDEEEYESNEPVRSRNEVADEPAEQLPEGFAIDENEPIEHVGVISSVIDKSIIVLGKISGEFRFLEEGSILCLEDRRPIGYLFEVFGPVARPLYRIKFDTEEKINQFKDLTGAKVFYVVPKSKFAYTDSYKNVKGSDASNWNDEELPEDEQEFSDDEKEMESKRLKKNKRNRKGKDNEEDKDNEETATKKPTKKPNNNSQKRNQSNNHNNQRQQQYQQLNEQVPVTGYHSRSQRESSQVRPQLYQNPQNITPGAFQPPPQMMYPPPNNQQFPVPPFQMPMPTMPTMPGMPPIPQQFAPPGVPPQQWMQMQQMFQMQQMMMAQQFFAQQNQNQNQKNNQNQGPPQ